VHTTTGQNLKDNRESTVYQLTSKPIDTKYDGAAAALAAASVNYIKIGALEDNHNLLFLQALNLNSILYRYITLYLRILQY
jgi:hypothetical protein